MDIGTGQAPTWTPSRPGVALKPEDLDPLVGQVLDGRYRLVRKVGVGGMGVIYEGVHEAMGKAVAVKLLHPALASDPEIGARFLNEARAAAGLRHPNIVAAFDLGRAPDGTPYLVLDLLVGESLEQRLARVGRLTPDAAIEIGLAVTRALGLAHQHRIVHRDLKPANLFLSREPDHSERLKVLDFGISKCAGRPGDPTRADQILGTPAFMAPELFSDARRASAQSDVYALGVVLYQAVSGALPFDVESLASLERVLHQAPPRLDRRVPGLPPALVEAIHRCLEKDPTRRFATMAEVGAALSTRTLAPQMVPATPPVAPSAVPTPRGLRPAAPLAALGSSLQARSPPTPTLSSAGTAHMAFWRFASHLVVVCDSQTPTDAEWNDYLDACRQVDADLNGKLELGTAIIFTDGGGPNSSQRMALRNLLLGRAASSAMVTESLATRTAAGLIGLFNPGIKVFTAADWKQACTFAAIPENQHMEVLRIAVGVGRKVTESRTLRAIGV